MPTSAAGSAARLDHRSDEPPDATPYEALLLVSFGGPEKPDDVVPFLENVTRGRGTPRERLVEVGEHYFRFGGRSPINDQCRALLKAIEADFAEAGLDVPVYWGNRNWDPYLADAVGRMRADGVSRAAYFMTSAYASYSSCRQYRENVADAVATVGTGAPRLDPLPRYFGRPGFIAPFVDATRTALTGMPAGARLVFVTHSIPAGMNDASGAAGGAYEAQHRWVAERVAGAVAETEDVEAGFDLVYCSRSGPPSQPWLEPDVNDHLEALAARGVPGVVLVPIGFVSDHLEVKYDLDTEAVATAEKVGLTMARAATPGTDPRFVGLVRELLLEQAGRLRRDPSAPLGGAAGADPVRAECGSARCCTKSPSGNTQQR